MISNKKINVDLSKKNAIMNPLVLTQYDKGFYVEVSLFDNGQPYTIEENESIRLEFDLGSIAVIESDITVIDTNKCKFKVRREMTLNSCKGTFSVAVIDKETGISIRKGSSKLAIEIVGSSVSENTVEPDLIATKKEELEGVLDIANEVQANLESVIETGDLKNYTLRSDFDNLQIGGSNYLLNTGIKENASNFTYSDTKTTRDTEFLTPSGNPSFYTDVTGLTTNQWIGVTAKELTKFTIGETYTFSAWVYIPSDNGIDDNVAVEVVCENSDGTRTLTNRQVVDKTIVDEWVKYSATFTVPTTTVKIRCWSYIVQNGKCYVGDFKLEKGNRPTDWTPATEDIDNKITTTTEDINSKIAVTKTELQKLISITALETKTALYPVGSLYFNATSSDDPSTLLGFGTWEQIAQGATLIGVNTNDTDFNNAGKTGGTKTNTLTLENLPSNVWVDADVVDSSLRKWVGTSQLTNWCNRVDNRVNTFNQQAINNLPPYVTCYIWKRVS